MKNRTGQETPQRGEEAPDDGLQLPGYTVLVAVENGHNRELIVKMLGALGYRAVEAGDGIEALDRLHRAPTPDLALMEVNLPRMNGIETVSAIRGLSSPKAQLPVVMITADVPLYQMRELPIAGVDAMLARPFDMSELAKTTASLLQGRLENVSAASIRRHFGVRS